MMRQPNKIPVVLFVCTDDEILAGSSKSLLNLIAAMRGLIHPIVLFQYDCFVSAIFRNAGIETISHMFYNVCDKADDRLVDYIRHPKKTLLYRRLHDDISCAKYVKRMMRGREVDIVHSNTSVITVGVALSKMLKAKHVWHIREFVDLDFGGKPYMGMPILRHLINTADYRICISEAVYNHWHFKHKNTEVVYNAVVPESLVDQCAARGKYILFCAAALTSHKGDLMAVEIFCRSGIQGLGYCLKLVGAYSEDEREAIYAAAKSYRVDASLIQLEGYKEDVSGYFQEATAFLMCSQCEALGRVTIEAMYYGCPVIARATGGTVEIVKDNATGYLFNTIEEGASCLKRVIASDQLNIVSEARDFVSNTFSAQAYQASIQHIYYTLLSHT